jgi:hypothetical protein
LSKSCQKCCQKVVKNFGSPGKNQKKVNRPENKNGNGNENKNKNKNKNKKGNKKKKIIGIP